MRHWNQFTASQTSHQGLTITRAHGSTEDTICTALHLALFHLKRLGSYVRLLFVDLCSACNTILPNRLVAKLSDLGPGISFRPPLDRGLPDHSLPEPSHLLTNYPQHRLPQGLLMFTLSTRLSRWPKDNRLPTPLPGGSVEFQLYQEAQDPSYPGHAVFELLTSGRWFRTFIHSNHY